MKLIRIHPADNVAVALTDLTAGERLTVDDAEVTASENIARGHKIALSTIHEGEAIVKYGNPIGITKTEIPAGTWVHVHNVRTGLSESADYAYEHRTFPLPETEPRTFQGYRREDGRAAVRNELWIIPTVGCVNSIAAALVKENQHLVTGSIDGLYTFAHPFGCSQMGEDHAQTRKLLAALVRHPNAGGVLVLSLGCENLTQEQFKRAGGLCRTVPAGRNPGLRACGRHEVRRLGRFVRHHGQSHRRTLFGPPGGSGRKHRPDRSARDVRRGKHSVFPLRNQGGL